MTARTDQLAAIRAEESIAALHPAGMPDVDWRAIEPSLAAQLERQGVGCGHWTLVEVCNGFDPASLRDCTLEGRTRLGALYGSSIRSCTISGCIVSGVVALRRCGLLQGLCILDGTVMEDCMQVVSRPGAGFGIGSVLRLGSETGERDLGMLPALDPWLAAALTGPEGHHHAAAWASAVERVTAAASRLVHAPIGPNAVIRATPLVHDTIAGPCCRIEAACSVRSCILLGGEGEGSSILDGAVVRDSALQWGATVDSGACVERSLICEGARVERNASVTGSLLGADSAVAAGEVTATLAGPQTAAHHQSLLIAARWPEGCGNVGYGANVGSNHTSRLPDQEISIGSGVFFGLGCSVKFPSCLAPGIVIATGVVLPPQRIDHPFSLVTQTHDPDVENACSLAPGWVLYANLFAFMRNLSKIRSRRTARRGEAPDGPAGPATAAMVLRARAALSSVNGDSASYLAADIPGVGACSVSNESRIRGIAGYTLYLRWLGLSKLVPMLEEGGVLPEADEFDECGCLPALAVIEYPGQAPADLMLRYVEVLSEMRRLITRSRTRDHERGSEIVPGYSEMHSPPDRDAVLAALVGDIEQEMVRAGKLR
jgi:hypothetical protein